MLPTAAHKRLIWLTSAAFALGMFIPVACADGQSWSESHPEIQLLSIPGLSDSSTTHVPDNNRGNEESKDNNENEEGNEQEEQGNDDDQEEHDETHEEGENNGNQEGNGDNLALISKAAQSGPIVIAPILLVGVVFTWFVYFSKADNQIPQSML